MELHRDSIVAVLAGLDHGLFIVAKGFLHSPVFHILQSSTGKLVARSKNANLKACIASLLSTLEDAQH